MSGLELLNPRGLWLLTAAVPLIVFYVLKIKRQRQAVPSTWLWAAAERDLLAKHPFRKLIAEVPLVLELLAIALLTLALARPAIRGGTIAGDHVAIVVDTSASMGTASHAPGAAAGATRMAEARAAALDVVFALSPGADAILIDAGREARVTSPLERDVRRLRVAIQSLSVNDVEGDLGAAVALAADRLRTLSGGRRIIVITDGALAHPAPLAPAGVDTQVITVGDAEDNTAIVRIDVRQGEDPSTKREQAQVFALVRNYGARPVDAFLTLTLEGRTEPVTSRRVLLPANERVPVVLTFEPQETDRGKGIVVQLSPGDALPLDDVAYGRVPAGERMPVTLASQAPYSWVARALDADPKVVLQRLTVDQLSTVNVDPDALVVVEGACPDKMPGHDVLIVAPPVGDCLGLGVLAAVDQPQITSWETGDPRFRFLTLDGVHVARALPLRTEGPGAALVRAGNETLVADASAFGLTMTLVGFDPGESDWPLKASFVLFVRNVVEIARLHRAQGTVGPVRTGEPLRIVVPRGVTSLRVDGPGMAEHELTAKGGLSIIPSVDRAGFYHARWSAPHIGEALIAANLTSELESDVRPRAVVLEAAGGSASAPTARRTVDAHHEWATAIAVFAALILALDLVWLTRRARPRLARTEASPQRARP
jgi:hypothetical protein